MKRSSQVALVLMGVTATTAAGAYLMPARSSECRPAAPSAVAQPAAAPPALGDAPRAAAAEEPCRKRRSWGTWSWGSRSAYDNDRPRSSSTTRRSSSSVSTAFRSSRTSTSSPSSSRTATSSSTSRGGFGSTGRSVSRSSGS